MVTSTKAGSELLVYMNFTIIIFYFPKDSQSLTVETYDVSMQKSIQNSIVS